MVKGDKREICFTISFFNVEEKSDEGFDFTVFNKQQHCFLHTLFYWGKK